MSRRFLATGAINAFLAVAFAALGKHSMPGHGDLHAMQQFQTAVTYHMHHALALILLGVIALHIKNTSVLLYAGGSLLLGIILFSGSLYLLAITGITQLAIITPIGGSFLLLGWLLLAWAILRRDDLIS